MIGRFDRREERRRRREERRRRREERRERRILETPGVREGFEAAACTIEEWKRSLEASGPEDHADMAAAFETLAPEPCGEPGCCRKRGHRGPCERR